MIFQVDHTAGKLEITADKSSADISFTNDNIDFQVKPGDINSHLSDSYTAKKSDATNPKEAVLDNPINKQIEDENRATASLENDLDGGIEWKGRIETPLDENLSNDHVMKTLNEIKTLMTKSTDKSLNQNPSENVSSNIPAIILNATGDDEHNLQVSNTIIRKVDLDQGQGLTPLSESNSDDTEYISQAQEILKKYEENDKNDENKDDESNIGGKVSSSKDATIFLKEDKNNISISTNNSKLRTPQAHEKLKEYKESDKENKDNDKSDTGRKDAASKDSPTFARDENKDKSTSAGNSELIMSNVTHMYNKQSMKDAPKSKNQTIDITKSKVNAISKQNSIQENQFLNESKGFVSNDSTEKIEDFRNSYKADNDTMTKEMRKITENSTNSSKDDTKGIPTGNLSEQSTNNFTISVFDYKGRPPVKEKSELYEKNVTKDSNDEGSADEENNSFKDDTLSSEDQDGFTSNDHISDDMWKTHSKDHDATMIDGQSATVNINNIKNIVHENLTYQNDKNILTKSNKLSQNSKTTEKNHSNNNSKLNYQPSIFPNKSEARHKVQIISKNYQKPSFNVENTTRSNNNQGHIDGKKSFEKHNDGYENEIDQSSSTNRAFTKEKEVIGKNYPKEENSSFTEENNSGNDNENIELFLEDDKTDKQRDKTDMREKQKSVHVLQYLAADTNASSHNSKKAETKSNTGNQNMQYGYNPQNLNIKYKSSNDKAEHKASQSDITNKRVSSVLRKLGKYNGNETNSTNDVWDNKAINSPDQMQMVAVNDADDVTETLAEKAYASFEGDAEPSRESKMNIKEVTDEIPQISKESPAVLKENEVSFHFSNLLKQQHF